jgi:hypothetical protein
MLGPQMLKYFLRISLVLNLFQIFLVGLFGNWIGNWVDTQASTDLPFGLFALSILGLSLCTAVLQFMYLTLKR